MRHDWERKPDKDYAGINCKVWVCNVCGCEKVLGYYKFAEPSFDRNGQIYSHYIECVDIEQENLKTID